MADQLQETRGKRGFLAVLAAAVFVGFLFAIPLLATKNELGFLVLLVVPLLCIFAWTAMSRASHESADDVASAQTKQKRFEDRFFLAIAAFFIAPLGMATIGALIEWNTEMNPLDRGQIVVTATMLGFVTGFVVAAAIVFLGLVERA